MARVNHNRSQLMLGCGSAALAAGLMAVPHDASAQAIQASETIVSGSATRIFTGSNSEVIEVASQTAVIDWTPFEDGQGNALDFLPNGNDVTFQNSPLSGDFAVLNRILPSTNGNVIVFDGTVISQLVDGQGLPQGPGGTVAFYSPTGLLIGSNAVFDVGNLILTTLDIDLASFDDFAINGGQLIMGASPTTASIQINPGASIIASAENSYFAVTAAEIQMLGTSDINGSQAYVAGEAVNLTVSNGLFDIQIPVGTTVQNAIVFDGDVGGPSSTGVTGDNHLIYAVAAAQTDPISLIFRGNLGFQPAASAGIVNGEIILSANYEVSGRSVDGGSVDGGINQLFDGNSAVTDIAGSIFLEGFNATSTLLAIANEEVQASSDTANSSVDGDLLMIGRNFSELTAAGGFDFNITGNVLVSARDNGGLFFDPFPGETDSQGGTAFIDAFDGNMFINGDVIVTAEATAGVDSGPLVAGTATGGFATVAAGGGTLQITGTTEVNALGRGASGVTAGGDVTGGTAQIFASQGGTVTLGGDTDVAANAFSGTSDTGVNTFGGFAIFQAVTGGALSVDGQLGISAFALNTSSADTGPGGNAQGGQATLFIEGNETIDVTGRLILSAIGNASAGALDGAGGTAAGGLANVFLQNGGTLNVGGNVDIFAQAFGGNGTSGGDADGGDANLNPVGGTIDITGNLTLDATATGGDASNGGGTGGLALGGAARAFPQSDGVLLIGGNFNAFGDGLGGDGVGGGDGTGGIAGLEVQTGSATIGGDATSSARGVGGNALIFNTLFPYTTLFRYRKSVV